MATILFQAAGAALGGVFGPVGAIVGRAAGALAGSVVDRALLGGGSTISGARLATARIPGADEGTAINRLYGTARIGGTLIWATRFEEEVTKERAGGKGSGPRIENFRYFANFAVGLCEGPIACVRRVWADGRELDLTSMEMRVYRGTEDQFPDPLIEAKQGEGNASAYRGLAYVVFERLPLETFGNRIPLLQFEVVRPVGRLEKQIRAVTMIPGATEHGYATERVTEKTGEGSARIMNRNTLTASTDWEASLDELTAVCPNLESVALVLTWFGTDLRAGHCRIVPGVEVSARKNESRSWSVSGILRGDAYLIGSVAGGPAYGGTPSDRSVLQAIADLKARGLKVYLYPFVMMDVPPGNGLPDPYGGSEQSAFPWRGRITCFPAPMRPGSADRTAMARTQVDAFCGSATAGDFRKGNGSVRYEGRDEGYRRMILHYAHLATVAGGIDGFVIGSELRGLTQLRDDAGGFPFVQQLVRLAEDVRAIVGTGTRLTYGADWSEYFGYHPQDGSGEVHFHLDPLWASSAIDAVGIDNYMPISDWRDSDLGDGNPDGFRTADDVEALQRQIEGGEGFDWYYAGAENRENRIRSPITDGLAQKHWTFRHKDIFGWWSNRHYDRVGGAEKPEPTAWEPGMKPVWFTELGCAAIDKGANQPNVFLDPKSTESAVPHFSSGARSDSMQRRFLEAHHDWWRGSGARPGMVDPDHLFVWTWDARPYPAFPNDLSLWSDGGNWRTGHWLNGRLGGTTLADAIAALLTEHGFADFDVSEVSGDLVGYVQGEVTSARALLEPLLEVFQVDVREDAGQLRFRSRGKVSLAPQRLTVLADPDDGPLWSELRGHDSDFAAEAILTSYNPALNYEQASTRSRRARAESLRVLGYDLPAVLAEETALIAVENLLRDHRIARRTLNFALPPNEISPEPGDAVQLADGPDGVFVIERIEEGATRRIEARRHSPASSPAPIAETGKPMGGGTASNAFSPVLHFLDLPRFSSGEATSFARVAGFAKPWRRIVISASVSGEGYRTRAVLDRPARVGLLVEALSPSAVFGRFDRARTIVVDLSFGGLSSVERLALLSGENRIAVQAVNGVWEVIDFAEAEEIGPNRWRLSGLLRGLAGSEDAASVGAAAGAPVVVLDAAVMPLGLASEERGLGLNWLAEAAASGGGRIGPQVFTGGIRAETPLSPVHLRGTRQANGDICLSWTRRSRIDADTWEGAEIPLDEPEERYLVEIMDGTAVKRTAEANSPAFIYGTAAEAADFGAPQERLSVRIRQLGRAVALGLPASATISF